MIAHVVDEAPEALCKLPAFRPVVTKMLQCLSREDASMADLTRLVHSDPAMGAEILALANSAIFGLSATVRTVSHAISMLGTERVRKLATAIAVKAYLRGGVNNELVRNCWAHSVAAGVICEELAAQSRASRELAYTTALLHEIGRLGLLLSYPKEYAAVVRQPVANAEEMLANERAALGFDHCAAGLWLTRTWMLPPEFLDASSRHHEAASERSSLLAIVSASCSLASRLGYPEMAVPESAETAEPAAPPPPDDRLEALRPRLDDLQQRIERTLQSMG